jgi:hypothetical protein
VNKPTVSACSAGKSFAICPPSLAQKPIGVPAYVTDGDSMEQQEQITGQMK